MIATRFAWGVIAHGECCMIMAELADDDLISISLFS